MLPQNWSLLSDFHPIFSNFIARCSKDSKYTQKRVSPFATCYLYFYGFCIWGDDIKNSSIQYIAVLLVATPKRVTVWKKEALLALKHLEEKGEKNKVRQMDSDSRASAN